MASYTSVLPAWTWLAVFGRRKHRHHLLLHQLAAMHVSVFCQHAVDVVHINRLHCGHFFVTSAFLPMATTSVLVDVIVAPALCYNIRERVEARVRHLSHELHWPEQFTDSGP